MPSFHQRNGTPFASVITGPRHVMLGLVLGREQGAPSIVELPPVGGCDHGTWDHAKLRAAVDRGLAEVAERYGVTYAAREIHCVPDDTPSYDLAARCAFLIGERLAQGGAFESHAD